MLPIMTKLKKNGLTQKEIANHLDITQSDVCRHLQRINGE